MQHISDMRCPTAENRWGKMKEETTAAKCNCLPYLSYFISPKLLSTRCDCLALLMTLNSQLCLQSLIISVADVNDNFTDYCCQQSADIELSLYIFQFIWSAMQSLCNHWTCYLIKKVCSNVRSFYICCAANNRRGLQFTLPSFLQGFIRSRTTQQTPAVTSVPVPSSLGCKSILESRGHPTQM